MVKEHHQLVPRTEAVHEGIHIIGRLGVGRWHEPSNLLKSPRRLRERLCVRSLHPCGREVRPGKEHACVSLLRPSALRCKLWLLAVGMLAVLIVAAVVGAPIDSDAAVRHGPHHDQVSAFFSSFWSKPQKVATPLPRTEGNAYPLVTVSCTSASFCLAGGSAGRSFEWDGHSWHKLTILPPRPNGDFTVISCVSAYFCMAEVDNGEIYQWRGTSWTLSSSSDFSSRYFGLSCSSTSYCVAPNGGVWDGKSWSHPSSGPASPASAFSIDCTSPGHCMVLGTNIAYALDRSTVGTAVHISGHSYPLGPSGKYYYEEPEISCSSASACLAVGGTATDWNGSSWSPLAVPVRTFSSAVSCAPDRSLLCVASGAASNTYTVAGSYVLGPFATGGVAVEGISCPTPKFCMAVGQTGYSSAGFALTHTGSLAGGTPRRSTTRKSSAASHAKRSKRHKSHRSKKNKVHSANSNEHRVKKTHNYISGYADGKTIASTPSNRVTAGLLPYGCEEADSIATPLDKRLTFEQLTFMDGCEAGELAVLKSLGTPVVPTPIKTTTYQKRTPYLRKVQP